MTDSWRSGAPVRPRDEADDIRPAAQPVAPSLDECQATTRALAAIRRVRAMSAAQGQPLGCMLREAVLREVAADVPADVRRRIARVLTELAPEIG